MHPQTIQFLHYKRDKDVDPYSARFLTNPVLGVQIMVGTGWKCKECCDLIFGLGIVGWQNLTSGPWVR